MANKHVTLQEAKCIDYTPAAVVSAGNVINLGAQVGVSPSGIAALALGALQVEGGIRSPFVGGVVGNVGDNVWWDADGTPYGGTNDGACTLNAAAGDFWMGTLIAKTSATGATCDVALNRVNPNLPAWPNKTHVATAADLTYVAATHNGKVIHVTADAKTVTLPVGVAGMEAIVVNDCADAGALVTVDLNGNETIEGNLTIAATKTALNTKLTAKRGDFLHLVCETAAGLWVCVEKRGTWVTSE